MTYSHIFRVSALLLVLWGLAPELPAQTPDQTPPNQPATDNATPDASKPPSEQPAEPQPAPDQAAAENPRATPRKMMKSFLLALDEAEETPERINDAVACLDLSTLEPDAAAERGPALAQSLGEIIEHIVQQQGLKLEMLPDEPTAKPVTFGDQRMSVTLAPDAGGAWQFTAQTIDSVPDLQQQLRKAATTQEVSAPSEVPPEHRSARATMETFLKAAGKGDLQSASRCLDLSEVSAATRDEMGNQLAAKLKYVMDRIAFVVLVEIPDDPRGKPFNWHVDEHGRIVLARQESGERAGEWLFTTGTVASIESLFKAYEGAPLVEGLQGTRFWTSPSLWLRGRIPPILKGKWVWVEHWQWLGLALALVAGMCVHKICMWLIGTVVQQRLRAENMIVAKELQRGSIRPIGILLMVTTWWAVVQLLDLSATATKLLSPAIKFVLTVAGVWASYRIIDLVAVYFAARADRTPNRLDDVLVPLCRKLAKIFVVVVGLLFILKALGTSQDQINKLFAGLGIGGLAIALAAQDSLRNFFGSLTVVFDRPFQVGDWVKIGDVEGTVESVGLRSSRIRTFYNSEVSVPNSDLIGATVDNMGRRRYRRISCKLAVTYDTEPEKLEAFCEGIRELIRQHPFTRKDYYQTWVTEFADSSINILLYCFHETPDWTTEMRERHRLFLDIIRLARRLGVEFAFPTQTIHLAREDDTALTTPPPPPGSEADAGTAREWGRTVAGEIAAETIGDKSKIPPRFVFPKA